MKTRESDSYRYVILVSAILLQACFGATYSWAVFVEPLKQLFGKGQGAVQFPFSVFYIFFPFTMIFSGYILDKTGVRLAAILGIAIFGAGWILAGAGEGNLVIVTLGIGLVGGVGVGIGYVIPIKTCVQWFPRNKGLATGLSVAGFGGGAALVSQAARYLMENFSWTPFQVYKTFGFCFLCVGGVCACMMKSPDGQILKGASRMEVLSTIRDKRFLLLYLGMFTGLFAGFAVIANLKHIFRGATPLAGATAVSLFAVCNALGRISWGFIHDHTKGKFAIIVNLLFQSVILLTHSIYMKGPFALYAFASLAGFNYGGALVLYASEAAGIWGAEKLPRAYGWIFSANIAASLSPVFAGYFYDRFDNFTLSFALISLLMLGSCITIFLSQKRKKVYGHEIP
ncbi:MFS transporter [Candidatus Sumerlaeota bacterium]|nr:MFS transporter [Candidatus Sumerlaeota bacterium]